MCHAQSQGMLVVRVGAPGGSFKHSTAPTHSHRSADGSLQLLLYLVDKCQLSSTGLLHVWLQCCIFAGCCCAEPSGLQDLDSPWDLPAPTPTLCNLQPSADSSGLSPPSAATVFSWATGHGTAVCKVQPLQRGNLCGGSPRQLHRPGSSNSAAPHTQQVTLHCLRRRQRIAPCSAGMAPAVSSHLGTVVVPAETTSPATSAHSHCLRSCSALTTASPRPPTQS